MQCPVCHNEVGPQAAFCNHCGASLAAAQAPPAPAYTEVPVAAAPPPAAYPPPAGYPPVAVAASSGLTATAAAAIAYISFIPAIIFLVIEPYNKIPLVRFHSMQSIALSVVYFVVAIALAILAAILAVIPGLRLILFLFPLVHLALFVGFFLLWLMAIMKASKGEFYKLPIVGDFAMKQAQS
jgi:uncharacterized membrane protein